MSEAFSGAFFFFQAEDGIRDVAVTGVQTCALPICRRARDRRSSTSSRPTTAADLPPQQRLIAPTDGTERRVATTACGQGTGACEGAAHLRLPAVRGDLERARHGVCAAARLAGELPPQHLR